MTVRPVPFVWFLAVLLLLVVAAALMFMTVLAPRRDRESEESAAVRVALALQLSLLQQGDHETLRDTFTEPLRPSVTEDYVRTRGTNAHSLRLDDLIGRIAVSESAGRWTAEVRTPEGLALARLLLVDGRWLADTLWFP